ncbi:alanine racemase [Rhodosalinus halophilus]|uniref:Alanine racemase n=1 Tax=Rhodosalinus halophilus TaxID=2259333 RepID=A0A365U6A6_9RHOB|nr:alanine racemase [Rhodosalinus halophilus]RBI83897.1 alanine racemase [Rhodosalinus halophilus]
MAEAELHIDLGALAENWRRLAERSAAEAGAVVKADGYGLGLAPVAQALARAGARKFFTAIAEEGARLRQALGPEPEIFVFGGHMPGDAALIRDAALVPLLNSPEQMTRHLESAPQAPFGIQLDSGMNRLGMEPADWAAVRGRARALGPRLVMSHLACADAPDHPMNARQLAAFRAMTEGIDAPRSLGATGGALMDPAYHFDLTRPGIGVYGGLPFAEAQPVVTLRLPVIQTRDVSPGESVGYGMTWIAERPARIATVSGGYGDGIARGMAPQLAFFHDGVPCPVRGRISMDLIGVEVTHLPEPPEYLELLGADQRVGDLAQAAGTIGYEILTSLGQGRYARRYTGG